MPHDLNKLSGCAYQKAEEMGAPMRRRRIRLAGGSLWARNQQRLPALKLESRLHSGQMSQARPYSRRTAYLNTQHSECDTLGNTGSWINQRLKSIEIRKDLTNEWKRLCMASVDVMTVWLWVRNTTTHNKQST